MIKSLPCVTVIHHPTLTVRFGVERGYSIRPPACRQCADTVEKVVVDGVAKLRRVDVLVSQRQLVADAVRGIGVTEVTYYRWRQEFGGLKTDQIKRMINAQVRHLMVFRII
jgi:hypothetical protein